MIEYILAALGIILFIIGGISIVVANDKYFEEYDKALSISGLVLVSLGCFTLMLLVIGGINT